MTEIRNQQGSKTAKAPLCPLATSATYLNGSVDYLKSLGCRRKDCPNCNAIKRATLVARIVRAQPTKFITLTCRHELGPQTQLKTITKALPRLVNQIRRTGECEYIRVLELCADGYPHYHLLARTAYIDQKWLSQRWHHYTGAAIVDIRKAHGRSRAYITKYLTKSLAGNCIDIHQRFAISKKFFQDNQPKPTITEWKTAGIHPTEYAHRKQEVFAFTRRGATTWEMHEREPGDELPPELLLPLPDDGANNAESI